MPILRRLLQTLDADAWSLSEFYSYFDNLLVLGSPLLHDWLFSLSRYIYFFRELLPSWFMQVTCIKIVACWSFCPGCLGLRSLAQLSLKCWSVCDDVLSPWSHWCVVVCLLCQMIVINTLVRERPFSQLIGNDDLWTKVVFVTSWQSRAEVVSPWAESLKC